MVIRDLRTVLKLNLRKTIRNFISASLRRDVSTRLLCHPERSEGTSQLLKHRTSKNARMIRGALVAFAFSARAPLTT